MFDSRRTASPVTVLGVDPGLADTGWGVVEMSGGRPRCLAYGCVSTDPGRSVPERLASIYAEILRVVERYAPDECAVETVFFGSNAKSAFATGQARGVALLATAEAGLTLGEYSPVQVKSDVTGQGRADKGQVAYMVRALLELPEIPRPDHAADALAVALCHLNRRDAATTMEASA